MIADTFHTSDIQGGSGLALFPLIHIAGPPRRRGLMYGEAAAPQIHHSMTFYSESVLPALGLTWGRICDHVSLRIPQWAVDDPDLFEEIDGIAAGCGLEVTEVVSLNTRASFRQMSSQAGEARVTGEGCTSFAVLPTASRDGHMIAGQNWDYLDGIGPSIVLLHITPERGPAMLMIVEAGQLGRHGANTAGIAMHANGLSSRLLDPRGLPSPLWRRQILREGDMVNAIGAATATPREGSTNIVISHRDGFAVNIETWTHTARWHHPENGWLVHTNHYLAEIPPEIAATYRPSPDSILRYGRARQLMAEAARHGVTVGDLKAMLRDHFGGGRGICTHPVAARGPHQRWETVAAVITDLTTGVMSVAAGPPCSHEFTKLDIATGTVLEAAGAKVVSA